MKFACVFSGVGALAYGLTTAGHEPILLADCDEHAKQCLRQHFPGVELHGDVASLSALPEGTELLTGGFPCPDVSANNPMRTGMDGHRTGNFKHVIRLLKRHRVEYVLLENVTGILHRDHREPAEELHDAFQRSEASDAAAAPPHVVAVFDALEALHYHVAQRVLDLRGFGLPHMRRRVFILGALHANPRDILLAPRGKGIYSSPAAGPVCSGACAELVAGLCYHCYQHCRLRVLGDDPVANAVSRPAAQCASPDSTGHFYEVDDGLRLAFERGCYRHCLVIDLGEKRCPPQLDAVQTITTMNGCRTCVVPLVGDDEQQPPPRYLTPEEVELLFGLPAGWTACCMQDPAAPLTGADVLAGSDFARLQRHRFRLLGNAVPVPMGAWIGRRLLPENMYRVQYIADPSEDTPLGVEELGEEAWPPAVYSLAGRRFKAAFVGEFPVPAPFTPLLSALEPSGPPVPPSAMAAWAGRMAAAGWELGPMLRRVLARLEQTGLPPTSLGIPDDVGEVGFVATESLSLWPAVLLDPTLPGEACYIPADIFPLPVADAIAAAAPRPPAFREPRAAVMLGIDAKWKRTTLRHVLPYAEYRDIVVGQREARRIEAQPHLRAQFDAGIREASRRFEAQQGGAAGAAASGTVDLPSQEGSATDSGAAVTMRHAAPPRSSTACGRCRMCQATPTRSRSLPAAQSEAAETMCMLAKAAALARSTGHVGAELTVLGDKAEGRRVLVFWPLEDEWFPGAVGAFDAVTTRHTINYLDGETEHAMLWTRQVKFVPPSLSPAPAPPALAETIPGRASPAPMAPNRAPTAALASASSPPPTTAPGTPAPLPPAPSAASPATVLPPGLRRSCRRLRPAVRTLD